MNANRQPTRPVPPPTFQPLMASPARWRAQVLQQLTATAQGQRAILIHHDHVFAHHLQATLEHAGTRVCALTATTPPHAAHAATVVLSTDLDAAWRLLMHEDALQEVVRPTTLFFLLSPQQLDDVLYTPRHFQAMIAHSRAFHVKVVLFDPAAQLSGTDGGQRTVARAPAHLSE